MSKLSLAAVTLAMFIGAVSFAVYGQSYSLLHDFGAKPNDPKDPQAAGIIAQGRDGNLYSTTPRGGEKNQGAVFRISPDGHLTTLYSFKFDNGDYGSLPYGGLTLGTDGSFYGTTYNAGRHPGTIFRVNLSGKITTLYKFHGADGAQPLAPPIQGTDGNFYGTTNGGGSGCMGGCGTIYKITPSGVFTQLYQFDGVHGRNPIAPLVEGADRNFYGTTYGGGIHGSGVIFKITRRGKLTVLHAFNGKTGGGDTTSPLVLGNDGKLYGTSGDSSASGWVFSITPAGTYTVLYTMNGTTDGYSPLAGLVQATDGNFYGANMGGGQFSNCGAPCGTLFQVSPAGTFTVLYDFDGTTGADPLVTPFQHTNGLLYGDTGAGGLGKEGPCKGIPCGVFYSLNNNLPAFVTLLPYSGKVGKTIEFLGQGFMATTAISFNGTSAAFTVKSDTYLTAIVPTGATTGFVNVVTPSGTLTSNKEFRVLP